MAPTAIELATWVTRAATSSNIHNNSSSSSGGHFTSPPPGTPQDQVEALQRINEWGPYGYRPALAGGVVFTIVYGICAIVLTYQSLAKGRRWWMLATLAFGAFAECVGNGIRIYSHFHPSVVNPYIAQQCILVLTPAFIAAAHFTILTKFCQAFGEHYLRPIRAKWLIPVFVVLDVASLGVQGAGSGNAAVAETNGESITTINGHGEVVVAGLAVQLFAYCLYNVLFVMVIYRVYKDKTSNKTWFDGRMRLFLGATWASSLLVLGRSAFRTAEMGIGWIGTVATVEWYYLVFDASFVALALIILCIVSPATYLPDVDTRASHKTSSINTIEKGPVDNTLELSGPSRRASSPETMRGTYSESAEKAF